MDRPSDAKGSRVKILLCEDDSNIATIARLALEQIGHHQVTWANDGEAAKTAATTGTFDVILLDEMMPKKSGADVCIEIRESGARTAPIIFLSANPQTARVEEFSPITVGYIAKPFDPMQLCSQIERILSATARQKAG